MSAVPETQPKKEPSAEQQPKPGALAQLWRSNKTLRDATYMAGAAGIIMGTLELPPVNSRVFPYLAGLHDHQRGISPLTFQSIQDLSSAVKECEESPPVSTVVEAMRVLRRDKFLLFGDLYGARREKKEIEETLARLEANYGTLEKPRYQIAPDFKYRPFVYKRVTPSGIEKNGELTKQTAEILRVRGALTELTAAAANRKGLNLENLTTNSINRVLAHPFVKALEKAVSGIGDGPENKNEKKLSSGGAEPWSLRRMDMLLSLTFFSSSSDTGSLYLPSPRELVEQLTRLGEVHNLPTNLQVTATSYAQVASTLDDITRRVIPDLVTHPIPLKFYPSVAALQAAQPHAAGYHSAYDHVIASCPRPLYDLIQTHAHELGHPGISSEVAQQREALRWATARCESVRRSCEAIERIEAILEQSLKTDSINPSLSKERVALIGSLLTLLQNENLQQERSLKLRGKVDGDGFDVYSQLDEAGAWLMQDIILTEYAHKHPKEGETLLRLRDWHCSMYTDPDHWPGYRFAEALKAKSGGDSAKAYRALSRQIGQPEKFLPELEGWIDAARKNRDKAFQGLQYDVMAETALTRSIEPHPARAEISKLSDAELRARITAASDDLSRRLVRFLDAHWAAPDARAAK